MYIVTVELIGRRYKQYSDNIIMTWLSCWPGFSVIHVMSNPDRSVKQLTGKGRPHTDMLASYANGRALLFSVNAELAEK